MAFSSGKPRLIQHRKAALLYRFYLAEECARVVSLDLERDTSFSALNHPVNPRFVGTSANSILGYRFTVCFNEFVLRKRTMRNSMVVNYFQRRLKIPDIRDYSVIKNPRLTV